MDRAMHNPLWNFLPNRIHVQCELLLDLRTSCSRKEGSLPVMGAKCN